MWRHLCFIGWNAHTNLPIDLIGSGDVSDSEATSGNTSFEIVNSTVTAPSANYWQTDMYNKHDHIITAKQSAYPGFWVVPVNGNFGNKYDLQKDSAVYFDMT